MFSDYAALWGRQQAHNSVRNLKRDKGVNAESSDITESRCQNPGFTLQVNSVPSGTQNYRRKAQIIGTPFKHWVTTVYWYSMGLRSSLGRWVHACFRCSLLNADRIRKHSEAALIAYSRTKATYLLYELLLWCWEQETLHTHTRAQSVRCKTCSRIHQPRWVSLTSWQCLNNTVWTGLPTTAPWTLRWPLTF